MQPLWPRFEGISSWARLTGKIQPVVVEIWEVALIISFDNIWFGFPSLNLKFGKDTTSGYSDIPNYFFWGRLPWEVVLIVSFHNIWLGLLSLSFKFGKDPTSGCWDIPIFQSSWLWAATYNVWAATYNVWAATYKFSLTIMPLRGPILQDETCQIFSWADPPR